MNLLTPFRRPEYFFRPSQIFRRIMLHRLSSDEWTWATLPWGDGLLVSPKDRAIGLHVLKVGLDDLPLCEVLWRLLDKGDRVIDVGGNIGLIASLMLRRVGESGVVTVLEPHPRSFAILEKNARRWGDGRLPGNLQLWPVAAGDRAGEAWLVEPEVWDENSGGVTVSYLEGSGEGGSLRTTVIRLDDAFAADDAPGLIKIDVEGLQDSVLRGAHGMLQRKAVRHVIFEVSRTEPVAGEMTAWLEHQGYASFVIDRDFWGPRLTAVRRGVEHIRGHATNVLATTDAELVQRRLAGRGWHCLSGKDGASRRSGGATR